MAVAAALRRPGKRAVAFVGDGGILMTGNEIATARREGVAPIIILSNNAGYGTIGMHHEGRYPGRPYDQATSLVNPDFLRWCEAFRVPVAAIEGKADFPALEAMLRAPGPAAAVIRTSLQAVLPG